LITPVNQNITATNGKVKATGWIHKTGDGNLEIFGGFNGVHGTTPPYEYSVWTHDVTVDNGTLKIQGNACVRMDGSIYSSGNMWLTANYDQIDSDIDQPGDIPRDYLIHHNPGVGTATIESRDGDVDLSAYGDTIYLDGGPDMPDAYVSAGRDILIRDYTWVQYSRKLDAVDDVVLEGGKRLQGNVNLTLVAGDDIILGVTGVDNHETTPMVGFTGDREAVRANGDLTLIADEAGSHGTDGGDIIVHGVLETIVGSGGDIIAQASDDIFLKATPARPDSAESDGSIILTADSDNGNFPDAGDLVVEGNLEAEVDIELSASDNTIYIGGDYIKAVGNILLNNNTIFDSGVDQLVEWCGKANHRG